MTVGDVKCPDCSSVYLTRYGKTQAGRQKYRCLEVDCQRQFVAGSHHLVDKEVKARVEKALAAGVNPGQIAQVETGISLRWIYKLQRKMRTNAAERNG